jgi:hypothetical protein
MAKQREGYLQDYMTELDPDDPIITTETFSVQADKEYQKELQAFREKQIGEQEKAEELLKKEKSKIEFDKSEETIDKFDSIKKLK